MTIPASTVVSVIPGVLSPGGSGLVMNGLVLTQNLLMPTNSVLSFANAQAVSNFFGPSSAEFAYATIYFAGFVNGTQLPSAILFAPYNAAARGAWMRSGSFAGVSLAQLQNSAGASVTASVGSTFTASAGSPSTQLVVTSVTGLISIGDTLSGTGITASTTILSQVSGTTGGAGTYVLSAANTCSSATVTSFGTVLKVTAVGSGVLNPGNSITGTGITSGTTILSQISGTTGGIGIYSLSAATAAYAASGTIAGGVLLTILIDGVSQSSTLINLTGVPSFSSIASTIAASFSSGPTVTWDSVHSVFQYGSNTTGSTSSIAYATGSGSAPFLLTSATGATLSQGAAADTPSSAMNNVVAVNRNWATMSYLVEPSLSGKEALAAWFGEQDDQYLGAIWDSDSQASVQGTTEAFGVVAKTNQYNGVMCIGGDPAVGSLGPLVMNVAAFVQGMIASINFSQTNGRITLAGKSAQASEAVLPTCASLQTYENLIANGYNCYGSFASRNQGFTFFSNGNLPGTFPWADQYINQIWLNAQFQLALLNLYTTINDIPYDPTGYGLIRSALVGQPTTNGNVTFNGPINNALNAGVIQPSVALSSTQAAAVNSAAGFNVAGIIQSNGWYLQILDPGATARNARQTPIINFWYTDGGSIQQFVMDSIDIV